MTAPLPGPSTETRLERAGRREEAALSNLVAFINTRIPETEQVELVDLCNAYVAAVRADLMIRTTSGSIQ